VNNRPNHYYVGSTQKYTTINSAYAQWVTDGKPQGIIHILAGEYNETLFAFNCEGKLSIIGESKHDVIWHTKTGYYKDCPLAFHNGYLKNITFIADMTDNPDFEYVSLTTGDGLVLPIGSAYALHIDFPGAGTTIVENCDMISYVNAGLGCGTRQDQTLKLINCNIYSYTPADFDAEAAQNGGMLYHSAPWTGHTNQKLILHNVNVFSENEKAASIQNQSPDVSNAVFMEFVNVNLSNNNSNPVLYFTSAFGLTMSTSNYGNNVYELNSPISGYIPGNISDADLCKNNGFNLITVNGPQIGANTVIQTTMVNALYGVQTAWILGTGETYTRILANDIWSSWVYLTNSFNLGNNGYLKDSNIDANDCITCGLYMCTENVPVLSAVTYIQTITANNLYGLQYGWLLADGTKYKRLLNNGVWSAWTIVAES
jgi:hypothetical protein